MKVMCSVCELTEAKLICCADEAVLCQGCDEKIHAANNLAKKHQRVPLFAPSSPKCDLCQEAVGYFFCPKDRALLCQNCDASIHTMNNLTSAHQRFLLPGVSMGHPQPAELTPSKTCLEKSNLVTKSVRLARSQPVFRRIIMPQSVSEACSTVAGSCLGPAANVVESCCWVVPDYTSPSAALGLHWPANLYDGESLVPEILVAPFFKDNHSRPFDDFKTKRRKIQ